LTSHLAAAAILLSSFAPIAVHAQSLAESESATRQARTMEAQQLLLDGDAAYQAARYEDAASSFLKARQLLPDAPATFDLRQAATERYVSAALQVATLRSKKGDVAGARSLVDQVLAPDLAPDHPAAKKLRDQLLDPIRTNPALTAEHAQDVDEVRRTLYEADGFLQLGKFDMAKSMFEDILRIDPTNKAARRGMEKAQSLQSDYAKSAYDQTRAEMLKEVDASWQTAVPNLADSLMPDPSESANTRSVRFVSEKMKTILFPLVDLENVGIEEAVDFLRLQSKQLDNTTTNPAEKGFNIVLNLGNQDSEIGQRVRGYRFDLKLKNVPLDQILQYICDQTRTQFSIDEFAITLRPTGADGAELIGRTYKVPPDFLSAENVGAAAAASSDPFADAPEEGLNARRMTALDKLRAYGVSFPDGAKATYNANTSSIFVYNTALNHDMVQQIVDTMAQTEPVQVVVRVTMIKVLETQLKELGFDWLFGNVGLGGSGLTPGNKATFLGGGTTGNGSSIDDVAITTPNNNPVTAGNRSGNSAITSNAIDDRIAANTLGFSPSPSRAPGILTLLANNVSGGEVQMMMRGLDQKKGADVVSKPATITRSGQTSKIAIIQEFIYPTEYEAPEIPQQIGDPNGFGGGNVNNPPITPAMPTSFEKRDVGVVLEVSPVVSADRRYIELALKPELINFDGFVNYGTPITQPAIQSGLLGVLSNNDRVILTPNRILQPVFSITRADTNVTVADGSTIIIGGLVEERIQSVQDQVPVLGSLPLVGRLFQTNARQPIKKNVLIMVQVELQDPSGRPYRDR
jgi:general secretion pathway protein D